MMLFDDAVLVGVPAALVIYGWTWIAIERARLPGDLMTAITRVRSTTKMKAEGNLERPTEQQMMFERAYQVLARDNYADGNKEKIEAIARRFAEDTFKEALLRKAELGRVPSRDQSA